MQRFSLALSPHCEHDTNDLHSLTPKSTLTFNLHYYIQHSLANVGCAAAMWSRESTNLHEKA